MTKSPKLALQTIQLPERSDETDLIDHETLPVAHLVVGAGEDDPPIPMGVIVMIHGLVMATLSIEEIKFVARQIEEMEQTAKHGGRNNHH